MFNSFRYSRVNLRVTRINKLVVRITAGVVLLPGFYVWNNNNLLVLLVSSGYKIVVTIHLRMQILVPL